MLRAGWKEISVGALLWAGFALAQEPPVPSAGKTTAGISTLTLQEAGKPDQKVQILRTWRTPDGGTAYDVLDPATGKRATITENGPPFPGTSASGTGRVRSLLAKLLPWGRRDPPRPVVSSDRTGGIGTATGEPPLQAPVSTKETSSAKASPHATGPQESPYQAIDDTWKGQKRQASGRLVSKTGQEDQTPKPRVPEEVAAPSDWHLSWGKADDHRSTLAASPRPPEQPESGEKSAPDRAALVKPAKEQEQGPKAGSASGFTFGGAANTNPGRAVPAPPDIRPAPQPPSAPQAPVPLGGIPGLNLFQSNGGVTSPEAAAPAPFYPRLGTPLWYTPPPTPGR